jgi:hypothetical protein
MPRKTKGENLVLQISIWSLISQTSHSVFMSFNLSFRDGASIPFQGYLEVEKYNDRKFVRYL